MPPIFRSAWTSSDMSCVMGSFGSLADMLSRWALIASTWNLCSMFCSTLFHCARVSTLFTSLLKSLLWKLNVKNWDFCCQTQHVTLHLECSILCTCSSYSAGSAFSVSEPFLHDFQDSKWLQCVGMSMKFKDKFCFPLFSCRSGNVWLRTLSSLQTVAFVSAGFPKYVFESSLCCMVEHFIHVLFVAL